MATYGEKLPRRRLGRTELMVPIVSLGGVGVGGLATRVEEAEAIEGVRYAVEQGINYIDTSPFYVESERRIGIAIRDYPREKLILSTKTGTHPERHQDYSWDGTMWTVENSLKLLHTDYIDLLLVHDPLDIEPVFAPRGALEALEHLREQGVIRSIGLGQRRHDFHRRAIESGRVDAILTFNDYHPIHTSAADWLLPLAKQYDVGVLNGAAMSHGLLTGENPDVVNANLVDPRPEYQVAAARRLYQFCEEKQVSMLAVVFQFCMRQEMIHCTLTGAKNIAEIDANFTAATTPLPEAIWSELEALDLNGMWEAGEQRAG
jgi:aryl-alcohol dehydrogenase-like predicted oxidoreductase